MVSALNRKWRQIHRLFASVAVAALLSSTAAPAIAFADEGLPAPAVTLVQMHPNFTVSWQPVEGADHYNVYRNGQLLTSVTGTGYEDTASPDGNYGFQFSTVDDNGVEGTLSGGWSVLVDRTAPTITYTISPAPNEAGWYVASRVRVLFECHDANALQQCTSSPQYVNAEGMNQLVTGTATDIAGNTATKTVSINLDKSIPEIQSLELAKSSIKENETTTLIAHATDAMSGIVGGEYFIGNSNDPGVGQAAPMVIVDGKPTALIGAGLTPGLYEVYVRVRDAAGQWNQGTSIWLEVTPYITAPYLIHATRQPDDRVAISWDPTENAHHYNVYRDGQLIGSTGSTTFVAPAMPAGIYYYHITATNEDESYVSVPSNTIDVTISEPVPVNHITSSGNKYFVPSVANGDVLPGLSTNNGNIATYNLNVQSEESEGVSGSFAFRFNGGPIYCMILPILSGCHQISLNSQSITALSFAGDNYSVGGITGIASVTVDGIATTNPFRVEGVDGNRIGTAAQDMVTILIFAPDEDPDTAAPLYKTTATVGRPSITVQ